MADKKKMSVAEILAAARKADSQGGAEASQPAEPTPPSDVPPSEPQAEAEAPAPSESAPPDKPAVAKPGSGARPNVKDILAMARAGKGGAPAKPADAPAAKAKPAAPAEKPAAKAAPKKEPAAAGGPVAKDTASILAAARKGASKPGPVSKAEAAARAKPDVPVEKAKAKEKPTVPPMPARPVTAKAKPAAATTGTDRRGFIGLSIGIAIGSFLGAGFTSLAATTALWTLGAARYMFPNVLTEPPSKFKVGFPADFPPGMVADKFKAQFGVWVANAEYNGQQQIYALRTVCTHLGCTPNWLEGEQKYKCPCHGSGFYKDGINFEGPAPRPLERYAIRVADDGQLEIDKSKIFQEEMGQWKDPACFVPV